MTSQLTPFCTYMYDYKSIAALGQERTDKKYKGNVMRTQTQTLFHWVPLSLSLSLRYFSRLVGAGRAVGDQHINTLNTSMLYCVYIFTVP